MWHEARKQEKKIRTMIVDYRKRADRRKEFYEKIVSFLQLEINFNVCTNVFRSFITSERIQSHFYNSTAEELKFIMTLPMLLMSRICEKVESN
jgi:hypothetical protein